MGCFGCCKSDESSATDDFIEVDKVLVEFMQKYNPYKPPACTKVVYEVQWGHLHVSSEVVEFKLQPHNKTVNVLVTDLDKAGLDMTNQAAGTAEKKGHGNADNKHAGENSEAGKTAENPEETHVKTIAAEVEPHTATKDAGNAAEATHETNPLLTKASLSYGSTEDIANQPPKLAQCKTIAEPNMSFDKMTASESHSELEDTVTESTELKSLMPEKKPDASCDPQIHTEQDKSENKKGGSTWKRVKGKFKALVAFGEKKSQDVSSIEVKEQDGPPVVCNVQEEKGQVYKNPNPMCLFRTEYTNKSGGSQSFTFQTERKTTSSISINIQHSFKIGGKIQLGLKLPVATTPLIDSLDVTGEMTGEYGYTHSRTQTHQHEMTWSVNNAVKVEDNTKVIAELNVVEEEAVAIFKVRHTITPIGPGQIPVYVIPAKELRKPPDQRTELSVRSINKTGGYDFCQAFEEYRVKNPDCKDRIKVDRSRNCVEMYVKGVVQCVYQAKQVINVSKQTTDS